MAMRSQLPTGLRDKCLDLIFISMILISVTGLIYDFVRR